MPSWSPFTSLTGQVQSWKACFQRFDHQSTMHKRSRLGREPAKKLLAHKCLHHVDSWMLRKTVRGVHQQLLVVGFLKANWILKYGRPWLLCTHTELLRIFMFGTIHMIEEYTKGNKPWSIVVSRKQLKRCLGCVYAYDISNTQSPYLETTKLYPSGMQLSPGPHTHTHVQIHSTCTFKHTPTRYFQRKHTHTVSFLLYYFPHPLESWSGGAIGLENGWAKCKT